MCLPASVCVYNFSDTSSSVYVPVLELVLCQLRTQQNPTPIIIIIMKFTTAFALIFACLVASSVFIEQVEAGKKKKLILGALLLAALAKPKILPLPVST